MYLGKMNLQTFSSFLFAMAAKRRNVRHRRRTNKKKRNTRRKKSSFRSVLKKVIKLKPSQRMEAMKMANSKFINDLSREVKKLQHSRVPPKMKKRLRRHSKKLRKFMSRKTSLAVKRHMLAQQRGGFLPLLLAALPALGSIVGGIINRA